MTEAWWLTDDFDPADLLRVLEMENGSVDSRKLRLFVVACCRSAWHLLSDRLSRQAVETVERFADGQTTVEGLQDIAKVAEEACRVAEQGAYIRLRGGGQRAVSREKAMACALARLARLITEEPFAFRYQGQDASDAVVGLVLCYTPPPHLWDTEEAEAASAQAVDEQICQHCRFVRDIFGNHFCRVAFDPAWRTPAAVALARSMYEERRFDDMPLLGDALEEAGCTDPEILGHSRGPGPHVRGCWVVDLVLGKA